MRGRTKDAAAKSHAAAARTSTATAVGIAAAALMVVGNHSSSWLNYLIIQIGQTEKEPALGKDNFPRHEETEASGTALLPKTGNCRSEACENDLSCGDRTGFRHMTKAKTFSNDTPLSEYAHDAGLSVRATRSLRR